MRFLSLCWVFISVVFVLLEICLRLNNNRLLTKSNKIKGRLPQKWSNLDLLNDDRNMSQDELKKLAVEYDPPESCCASAVVARRPSQSPRDEKTIEFQSLRNGLIERTLRVTSCAGAAGRGSDAVMG